MRSTTDPRHQSRTIVLQELFLESFAEAEGTSSEAFDIDDYLSIDEIEEYDEELYRQILTGVRENIPEIDKMITKYAPQWPLAQIKKVDLQILRIAIYEGFVAKITPPKVAIDEGIELAKEFGGQASDKFVNGVLGAIYEKDKKKKNNEKK